MTLEEHEMLMLIFAKQAQMISALVELLKSRGIVEDDDMAAFHSLVSADAPASEELLHRTAQFYLKMAAASQVNLPPKTGETLL